MSEPIYASVEIGGTKIQCAAGTHTGRVVACERFGVDLARGAAGIRGELKERLPRLCTACGARAVGVGFGGPVVSSEGRTITSHQVQGWDDFPLRQWVEEVTGLPAFVENDSNCAGWAEYRLGAGRGTRSMVYMNVGSGIGGALILQSRLYNGQGFGAGEIGHTYVPVPEGGAEKLERVASAWAFVRGLQEEYPLQPGEPLTELCGRRREAIDGPVASEAALRGDRFVLEAFRREGHLLGFALANVVTLLCPEVVVVGGGLALAGEVLLGPLRDVVAERVIGAFRGVFRLEQSKLGDDAVTKGALLLAAEAHERRERGCE